jgi:hypothetical protein
VLDVAPATSVRGALPGGGSLATPYVLRFFAS